VEPSLDLSVVISTRNRARELERTLRSLQQQDLPDLAAELVIVDNGSSDGTAAVLQNPWPGLRIVALFEPIAGKSRALNRALDTVKGDLLVFTDDDITAGPGWLAGLHRASVRFPEAHLFCGPIVPSFPEGAPAWRAHPRAGAFFGLFQPSSPEGPLSEGLLPFGANFAVRRRALSGLKFRLDLGPSSENGPLLGEDTEFLHRVRAAGTPCIYVPSSAVDHHIDPLQLQPAWIFERAFHLGRTRTTLRRAATLLAAVPRQTKTGGALDPIERGGLLNFCCGQLAACGPSDSGLRLELESVLSLLDLDAHRDLLSESASSYLAGRKDSITSHDCPINV
jgi:glycosyltransferase involved in cell wall biosynthesis